MSEYKQRENSGILFKNDRKKTDVQPDYVGTINVGGVEFFIGGWVKQGMKKAKFMSLSFKPKTRPKDQDKPQMARSYDQRRDDDALCQTSSSVLSEPTRNEKPG